MYNVYCMICIMHVTTYHDDRITILIVDHVNKSTLTLNSIIHVTMVTQV